MTLKPGMTVRIYQDPYTCNKYEGKAALVRDETGSCGHVNPGYATWGVRFYQGDENNRPVLEEEVYARTFRIEDVMP